MKKFIKIISLLFVLIFALSLFSCRKVEDYVPEVYGEWDNNYIYTANSKIKTTGEDYETLVTSVDINGNSCLVKYCLDYLIKNHDIYMILSCENNAKQADFCYYQFDTINCVVKYDVETSTYTVITSDLYVDIKESNYFYRPTKILSVYEDKVLLAGDFAESYILYGAISFRENIYYTVDFDGNLVDYDIVLKRDYYRLLTHEEDYLISYYDNSVYLKKDYLLKEKKVFSKAGKSFTYFSCEYYKNDSVKGLLIKGYNENNRVMYLCELYFYDFETEKLYEPLSVNALVDFIPDSDCFYQYDTEEVEYFEFPKVFTKKSATVHKDAKIFKIEVDSECIRLNQVHSFIDKHQYEVVRINDEKMFYYDVYYNNFLSSCNNFFGGKVSKCYEYDFTSQVKKSVRNTTLTEDEFDDVYSIKNGIKFGNYVYYIQSKMLGGWGKTYLQLFKRYNVSENKIDTMQIYVPYVYENKDNLDIRSCTEFWRWYLDINLGYENEEVDYNNFLVYNK